MWRAIVSPGFLAMDEELASYVARTVDYAPYDPSGLDAMASRRPALAATIAASPGGVEPRPAN